MSKYFKKNLHESLARGIKAGEFAISFDEAGHEIIAIAIARDDRRDDLINFTSPIFNKEEIEDNLLLEDGFYPVKVRGKTHLAFVYASVAHFVPSYYAKDIRLSGGLIDLDGPAFMRDMRKAADHLAAENRKLLKEVKDLRKSLEDQNNSAPKAEAEDEGQIPIEVARQMARDLQ